MFHVPVILLLCHAQLQFVEEGGRVQKESGLWELVETKNMCFNLKLFMFVVVKQIS